MLKRGYKTWCERTALNFKTEIGVGKQDPLSAIALAEHLKVKLLTPQKITGLDDDSKRILLGEESGVWSAVTLCKGQQHIVIYNPCRGLGRQSNDIMHELAHIIIGHKANMMTHSFEAGIFLRYYDKTQEEEADWLAATLLLSRDALFRIALSGMGPAIAAKEYCVSERLLTMRLNRTGVKTILERRAGR